MKQVILYIGLFVLIFGCSKNYKPEKPKNLIPKDKMAFILVDLSLISSAKGINKKILEEQGIVPNEFVYKKHQIDSAQFATSNSYYAYYIDDYNAILQTVEDSLERLKIKYTRLDEIENKSKTKVDSLKRAKRRDSIAASKSDTLKIKSTKKGIN